MNMPNGKLVKYFTVATITFVLTACATAPAPPEGSAAARARLTQLQSNSALARHAPVEIRDAELAVVAAERTQRDPVVGRHLVLMAETEISIATAWAEARQYEDQRADLEREAETARLDSRTREANVARSDASSARRDASSARDDAERARSQTERARRDAAEARVDAGIAQDQAAASQQEAAELQRQLVALSALSTDRGLVVTLGDVLFETGESSLKGGTTGDLDTLAGFLNRYEKRTVVIEGHTDSVGNDASNMSLSQRRADAVMAYLVSRNVERSRLSAAGMGEGSPVGSNDSATGRQQNRRVEVIISNRDVMPL